MSTHQATTLVIAIVLVFAPFDCARASSSGDVKAIDDLQKQVDDAIATGDTERYVGLITDDAVLMPPSGPPVVGRQAIRSWSEAIAKRFRITKYLPVNDELVIAGDWAFRRATFSWTVTPTAGGDSIQDSGKFIILYKRQSDGSWRVARDIWNSNTPTP
jgi:uncharacterized protein (TIGR02246 family)